MSKKFFPRQGRTLLLTAVLVVVSVYWLGCNLLDNLYDTGGNATHTHTWGAWVVTIPATCDAPGVETRTCTQDASHMETGEIPMLTGLPCESDPSGGGDNTGGDNKGGDNTGGNNTGGNNTIDYDDFSRSCGNRPCDTVTIGSQTWMRENLNRSTVGSWCYNDKPDSCKKYGKLYTWEAAKFACPRGWHLPSRDEWGILAKFAGGTGSYGDGGRAGQALKSETGWTYIVNGINNIGTDTYNFTALPGGCRSSSANNCGISRSDGLWWTATEESVSRAYSRRLLYSSYNMLETYNAKDNGFSVRCVMDEKVPDETPTVHVHDWGDWSVTTPATCDAQGVETRTCKTDDSHKETRAIAKLTGEACAIVHVHDWGDWSVTTPATCDAQGVETRTCKTDNSHKETRAIAKLTGEACAIAHVHDWSDWVVTTPATCDAQGVETRTCKTDNSHKETRAIAKLTGEACTPTPQTDPSLVFDLDEAKEGVNHRATWYAYTYIDKCPNEDLCEVSTDPPPSSTSWHEDFINANGEVTFNVSGGGGNYDGGIGVGLGFTWWNDNGDNINRDIREYSGVYVTYTLTTSVDAEVYARITSEQIGVSGEDKTLTEYNEYQKLMPTTTGTTAQRTLFRFSDFKQQRYWGREVPLLTVLARSHGLDFQMKTNGTAVLSITKVELYK